MRLRVFVAVLTVLFLFNAMAATAYANEPEAGSIAPPIIPITEATPPQPLTPPGTGTVVDNVTNENSVEFFTITSAAGNIFFLIIDRQRETENVYFLNAVTEQDLLALAEEAGEAWEPISTPPPIIPDTPPTPAPEPDYDYEPEPEPDPEPEQGGGNMFMIILIAVIVLGGGGAGWYFKIYLPKQQKTDTEDDFDYWNEDEPPNPADPNAEDADISPWEVEETEDTEDGENRDDE